MYVFEATRSVGGREREDQVCCLPSGLTTICQGQKESAAKFIHCSSAGVTEELIIVEYTLDHSLSWARVVRSVFALH